jgi:hypothetical protein
MAGTEMTPELARLLELSGGVNVTIAAATKRDGNIDRKKADRMIDPHGYFAKNKRKNRLREYLALVEAAKMLMYHGTALDNVPNILRHGLKPSKQANATDDRWATLGGVYLTSDFDHAVKAAKGKYPDQPIAIISVQASTQNATPDEDVVERALIKAFTGALDSWGIDDYYDGDLEMYADSEEDRPMEPDEEPFDRQKFFRDFWATVMDYLTKIAGTPRKRDPDTVAAAVNTASAFHDDPSAVSLQDWQALKAKLVALYPRLRSAEQHAASGLTIAHNIRVTKPIRRSQIVGVMAQQSGNWRTIYPT